MARATKPAKPESDLARLDKLAPDLLATVTGLFTPPHDAEKLDAEAAAGAAQLAALDAEEATDQTALNTLLAQREAKAPRIAAERKRIGDRLDAIVQEKAELQTALDRQAIRERQLRSDLARAREALEGGATWAEATKALRALLERTTA